MKKIRTDSNIAQLTDEQRDQLFDWLSEKSYTEVIRLAAVPQPEGLNARFHKTTLVRFFAAERARRHADQIAESMATDHPSVAPEVILAAAKVQLLHSCYDSAHETLNSDARNQLSRALNRLETAQFRREQMALRKEMVSIEQQRLDLEIRKFEFSAVEAAAKHAVKLNEVSADDQIPDKQKYALARDIVFGPKHPGPSDSSSLPSFPSVQAPSVTTQNSQLTT